MLEARAYVPREQAPSGARLVACCIVSALSIPATMCNAAAVSFAEPLWLAYEQRAWASALRRRHIFRVYAGR